MRLICPNCDAEYEVDDTAIPREGRDVQCSNCGHAWFQAAHEAETVAVDPAPVSPPVVDLAEEEVAPAPPIMAGALQPKPVDDAILAILKEEAATELAARQAEQAMPLETQEDLGLEAGDDGAARARQIAIMHGEDAAAEPARQVTRRQMLPDIEEINSTLRPSAAVRHDGDDDPMLLANPQVRSGFRSGFVLMLVVAAVLVALYLMAPRLAVQIPGAKGAIDGYVAGVDQARVGLDGATKWVIGALRRLAGNE